MAYNRYQYETSPRKLQPEYRPQRKKYPKKSTARKTKETSKKQIKKKQQQKEKRELKIEVKVIAYIAIGFSVLLAISYRNSVINEKFTQNKSLKTSLAALQKENQQLEVNIENSLNLKTIEQSARELLGMQKLEQSQTVYINLPKQDYIEPASEEIIEEDDENLWQKIIKFIIGKQIKKKKKL